MEKIRPPKDFDLTTILFKVPVHVPKKAQTTQLRRVREGYRKGELTARLQKNGLFLVRSLMLGAEFANDEDSAKFARKYAAVTMLASSWHSFAEEKNGEDHGVTRRRLKLLDLSNRLNPEAQPTTWQLHSEATEQMINSIISVNEQINAVRSRQEDRMIEQSRRTGRSLGNTALKIAGVPIGDTLQINPNLDSTSTQQFIRRYSQDLKNEMLDISEEVGVVPSLAALAEPHGSTLYIKLKDEMPRPLADAFEQTEKSLFDI